MKLFTTDKLKITVLMLLDVIKNNTRAKNVYFYLYLFEFHV